MRLNNQFLIGWLLPQVYRVWLGRFSFWWENKTILKEILSPEQPRGAESVNKWLCCVSQLTDCEILHLQLSSSSHSLLWSDDWLQTNISQDETPSPSSPPLWLVKTKTVIIRIWLTGQLRPVSLPTTDITSIRPGLGEDERFEWPLHHCT